MHTRNGKLYVILLSLLVLLPVSGRGQRVRPGRAASESIVSTDFSQCGRPIAKAPSSFKANPADMAKLLNGVWVGTRYDKSGKAHLFNYVMAYDAEAKEAFIYEELDERMRENVFAKQFGPPPANAPTITYFYCGSPRLAATKDVFVKVSDNPHLNPAEQHLRLAISDKPLSKVWEALKESDTFTRPRGSTEVNAAFYTMSITPAGTSGPDSRDLRLDLAGQLRGSINKSAEYAGGRPVAGIESGVFQGVTTGSGNYLVSVVSYTVQCYGSNSPLLKLEANLPPMTNFRYTKVVIGPIGQ